MFKRINNRGYNAKFKKGCNILYCIITILKFKTQTHSTEKMHIFKSGELVI